MFSPSETQSHAYWRAPQPLSRMVRPSGMLHFSQTGRINLAAHIVMILPAVRRSQPSTAYACPGPSDGGIGQPIDQRLSPKRLCHFFPLPFYAEIPLTIILPMVPQVHTCFLSAPIQVYGDEITLLCRV